MRLSFVVPAYNEQQYLGACLESILAETRNLAVETEIVVVNNASTDGTAALARSFPGVTVVDEPRKGLTFARQAGLVATTGELVANVDADSRLPKGWVQQVLDSFERQPELLALSGPLLYYDLSTTERVLVRGFYMAAWMTYAMNRWVLRAGSMVQGGNFVITRRALEEIGGFNLAITFYGEDTDIARRLNAIGKVKFTFDLKMNSSARRLKKEGMLRTALRYSMNYWWTTFLERPFTLEHADIRELPEV